MVKVKSTIWKLNRGRRGYGKAMTQVGSLRRIEDVRLNRDKNLFIVSDQYDAMIDLRPFLLNLKDSNFKLFNEIC